MEQDKTVSFLIKKAGLIYGSEYRLAKEMGIPQQTLTNWKAGTRTCTPSDRARLAGLAEEDAVLELVKATIETSKGLKREQLERALGKALKVAGAGSALLLYGKDALASSISDFLRCIHCQMTQTQFHDSATVK